MCWALASPTEAQRRSRRAALAVSRGTRLLSTGSSTTLGKRTLWSWGWAATASAGREGAAGGEGRKAGAHPFTGFLLVPDRNPDGDAGPWCHTYRNMRLSWELCDLPKCCELCPLAAALKRVGRGVEPFCAPLARRPSMITTLGPRAPTTNNNNNNGGEAACLHIGCRSVTFLSPSLCLRCSCMWSAVRGSPVVPHLWG